MQSNCRSLDTPERQAIIWQPAGEFTKNPDMIRFPDGRLMLVFNACDAHWPMNYSRITLLESLDNGRTWGNPRVVHEAVPARGDERWVTPRLSRLSDGRLVVICDQNDDRHKHEHQSSGIYTWWSSDEGATWDGPHLTGIPGIETDRIIELDDGSLAVGAHFMRGSTQKLTEALYFSRDGGRTWGEQSISASDAVHNFCEGAYMQLPSGRIVGVMRENNHNNYPSYLVFSDDRGRTWTDPVPAAFSGDRPFIGLLPDGRMLVTYRNQSGRPGLYAWVGDIEQDHGFKVARGGANATHRVAHSNGPISNWPIADGGVALSEAGLTIQNGPGTVSRYLLMPPEHFSSSIRFEASIRIDAPMSWTAATIQIARLGIRLELARDWFLLSIGGSGHRRPCKLEGEHTILLTHREGLVEFSIDGEVVGSSLVYRETIWDRTYFGNDPHQRGQSVWKWVDYQVENPSEPAHHWHWSAESGEYPDQYSIDRWIELDLNTSPSPDHGYSSWLQLPDGEILVVDYSNEEAEPGKSCLKAYWLQVADLDQTR
jgi:hypothetical protein